jgi:hypothetical protein
MYHGGKTITAYRKRVGVENFAGETTREKQREQSHSLIQIQKDRNVSFI